MNTKMLPAALAALALAGALRAAETPSLPQAPTPLPTVAVTPLSNPPVTPDPRFTEENFAAKWPHISLGETRRLMAEKGVVLVDGRSYAEWVQGHLPGALPLPLGDFDKYYAQAEPKLKKARIIISYCHGEGCHLSDALADDLVKKGFKNVAVFWGGFPAWNNAGLPLEDRKGKLLQRGKKKAAGPAPTPQPKPVPKPK